VLPECQTPAFLKRVAYADSRHETRRLEREEKTRLGEVAADAAAKSAASAAAAAASATADAKAAARKRKQDRLLLQPASIASKKHAKERSPKVEEEQPVGLDKDDRAELIMLREQLNSRKQYPQP
jgi:hypothetical protein